jgi:uncharacterized protein YbjT (DUF2867 family)
MKRILITGAAGQIRRRLRRGLRSSYTLIRLLGIAPLGASEVRQEVVAAGIRDMAAMKKAMAGIDCCSRPRSWRRA